MKRYVVFFLVVISALLINACKKQVSVEKLSPDEFLNPGPAISIHTWWHWVDGAITKDGITKDLEAMKQAGIGQATILNIGIFNGKDFGVKRVVFDTPEWHELFQWALKEANRLDIKIGAHNCDGWSTSGGPWITPEMSMKQFVWTKTYISGGTKQDIQVPQPYSERNFYRDVALVAFKTARYANSLQQAKPVCRLNNSPINNLLFDGDPSSTLKIVKGDKISFSFENEFTAEKLIIHPRKRFMWSDMRTFTSSYRISSSNDGVNFKMIKEFGLTGLNKSLSTEIPSTSSKHYQIEVIDVSGSDSFIDFTIAEIELLLSDEYPSFYTNVPYLLEKTVATKSNDRNNFDGYDTSLKPESIEMNKLINLTDQMDENGMLNWTAPEGNWCVLRFGYTTTGAMNGPATAEGTGLECDKMDTAALNLHFNSFPQKLIDNAGEYTGNTFKFLLIDSWECGYQNWTASLPEEFVKNRGYSITNWIPALCGEIVGNSELTEAFLYDFRKTIADMVENNYYKHFRDLCHRENIEMHAEIIYGDANYPPLEILRTNSYVDLPMFEFWAGHNRETFTEYTPSKPFESFPVFAANGYNIPILGSEAYTGMAHYSESFNDLKLFGDRAFCSGINQMILHSYVHQPMDKKPGMTLGQFAAHFNRNNNYWQHASEWMNYQSRIQYALQKGTIASGILYYVGDQLPQYLENSFVNDLPFGYRGMSCNYDMLNSKATVKEGKIVLDNGIEYGILVLPASKSMELSTLKRIEELVKQGAVVFGPRPVKQYSLNGILQKSKEFSEITGKVWGEIDGVNITENKYGKGMVYYGVPIAEVIDKRSIAPEFTTNFPDAMNLMYIHKKYGGYDVFFVVNQTEDSLNRECVFAVGNKSPQVWNPMVGSILIPRVFASENGSIRIPVTFKPRESLIFIFGKSTSTDNYSKVFYGEKQIFPSLEKDNNEWSVPFVGKDGDGFLNSASRAGSYTFVNEKNEKTIKELKPYEITENIGIDGSIEFVPAYDAEIPLLEINNLESLTSSDNPDIKYFSGTAIYRIKFMLPENILQSGDELFLDIGKFESTVKVSLNENDLGISWMPGNKIKVTGLLKKENILEVEVANVFRNRIIGDYIQFGELKNIWTSAPVSDFLDKDKPLKPSGLLGPLTILRETSDKP